MRDREIDLPSLIHSPPNGPKQPGLGSLKARSQKLDLRTATWAEGAKALGHPSVLSQVISVNPD